MTIGNQAKRQSDVNVPNLIKSLSRNTYGWWADIFEVLTNVPYFAPSSLRITELRLLGLSLKIFRWMTKQGLMLQFLDIHTTFCSPSSLFVSSTVIFACFRLTDLSSSIVMVESVAVASLRIENYCVACWFTCIYLVALQSTSCLDITVAVPQNLVNLEKMSTQAWVTVYWSVYL